MEHLGRPFQVLFLLYLLPWSFCVGGALMSACGVTLHAIFPVFSDPAHGKLAFGILSSLTGLLLVFLGGYRLFDRVMKVCIAIMFVTVVCTAVLIRPDWSAIATGFFIPRIPRLDQGGLVWTIALMGGVGGTLTVLCYGYWIREEKRDGAEALGICRLDLACGYLMTAIFGIAMIIIASRVTPEETGKGAGLIVLLAQRLGEVLGPAGQWLFLIGAFGAVFSSLLGVWQSVPYIFADFSGMALGESREKRRERTSSASMTYRTYLCLLALVPMLNLLFSFKAIQKYYAVVGAAFIPFLAFILLYLNGRQTWVGDTLKNRPLTNAVLVVALLFFIAAGYFQIMGTG